MKKKEFKFLKSIDLLLLMEKHSKKTSWQETTNLNPSQKEYWTVFYESGPGIRRYEWYGLSFDDVAPVLEPYFEKNQKILQIGSGNSLVIQIKN